METTTSRYMSSAEVMQFFGGISAMTFWRMERDPALSFPKPMRLNRRKLYAEDEIKAWAASRRQPEAA